MKIALVHDDFVQWGGAERLFKAVAEIFPNSPIHTSIVPRLKGELEWMKTRELNISFMQKLPFKSTLYRHYFPLYPLSFENFVFRGFDVVFSSSARFAHGIITPPSTKHVAYINSPPRMFWEKDQYFSRRFLKLMSPVLSFYRKWDEVASQRPDILVANSLNVQKKIKKYYNRDSVVINPFVDLTRFSRVPEDVNGEYFLVVSRLKSWKRIDIAIEACNKLSLPLKIIGTGADLNRLKSLAGTTVEFLERLTDEEVVGYYHKSIALIHPQAEDFGVTILEALASGKPVIAYKAGGALETIIPGVGGELFSPQSSGALMHVLENFKPHKYSPADCRNHASLFSKKIFQRKIESIVEDCL